MLAPKAGVAVDPSPPVPPKTGGVDPVAPVSPNLNDEGCWAPEKLKPVLAGAAGKLKGVEDVAATDDPKVGAEVQKNKMVSLNVLFPRG